MCPVKHLSESMGRKLGYVIIVSRVNANNVPDLEGLYPLLSSYFEFARHTFRRDASNYL